MLVGAAIPRQTHILKSIEKNDHSLQWMRDTDRLHLDTWL